MIVDLVSLDTWQWYAFILLVIGSSLSYVITNMMIKPIWYNLHKNSHKLCEEIPIEWIRLSSRNIKNKKKITIHNPKNDLGLDYEDVEFPCGPIALSGNRTLRGWYIPSPTHSKELCIVAVHGGARDRRQHLRHVPELQKMGADNDNGSHCGGPAVLLFDKQEHGLSDGNHRGIGWFSYEGSDVYSACTYMKKVKGYKRVIAMGSSFGGVGVLTAAGYYDNKGHKGQINANQMMIDGVIAENPPHSRSRLVRDLVHSFGSKSLWYGFTLPWLICELLSLISLIAVFIRRLGISTPSPINIIQNISPRPLLITHGKSDTIVPFQHGKDLYDAASQPKDFLWVENCEHTEIYDTDPTGWKLKTQNIINLVMKIKPIEHIE